MSTKDRPTINSLALLVGRYIDDVASRNSSSSFYPPPRFLSPLLIPTDSWHGIQPISRPFPSQSRVISRIFTVGSILGRSSFDGMATTNGEDRLQSGSSGPAVHVSRETLTVRFASRPFAIHRFRARSITTFLNFPLDSDPLDSGIVFHSTLSRGNEPLSLSRHCPPAQDVYN